MKGLPDGGRDEMTPSRATSNDDVLNQYEIYVDISSSMRPYLHERGAGNSNFRNFLKRLGTLSPKRYRMFAFGTPASAKTIVQPSPWPVSLSDLTKSMTYSGLSNDYGQLMSQFKKTENLVERLVLSDGVHSPRDIDKGSTLGATAGEINRWISDGGTFALFLFRAPYYCDDGKGQFAYFSETLRDRGTSYRVAFNTDARPFVVFAFLTSEAALDRLKGELINGIQGDADWALEIRKPTVVKPLEVQWAPDPNDKTLLKRIRLLEIEGVPSGVRMCSLPLDSSGRKEINLDFSVKLNPQAASDLPTREREQLLRSNSFSATVHMIEIPPGRVAKPVEFVKSHYDPAIGRVRLTVPQSRKDGSRRLWYVKLTPSSTLPVGRFDTDVTAWSTLQDDSEKTQNRILNLQSVVDEIGKARGRARFLPSSTLLFTD